MIGSTIKRVAINVSWHITEECECILSRKSLLSIVNVHIRKKEKYKLEK